MIIYIDDEGKEKIIRSNELIENLIKNKTITSGTLIKKSIRGNWQRADSLELFSSLIELKDEKDISSLNAEETSTLDEEVIESSAPSSESTNESEISEKVDTNTENESQIVKDISTSNVDETLITKEEEKEVIESSVAKSKPAQQKTEVLDQHKKITESTQPEANKEELKKDNKTEKYVPQPSLSFTEAISTCFGKYANFSGRARRSEFWYWVLFLLLVNIIASILDVIIFDSFVAGGPLYYISELGLIIPNIAVTARRLHDSERSGWRQLWSLTGIGGFFVLYWLIIEGNRNKNYYDKN